MRYRSSFLRVCLGAWLALTAGACASASGSNTGAPRMQGTVATAPDSVGAARAASGFLAAFDSLQWEPFRAYFADDVTMFFPFPQVPKRLDGRAAVERVFSQFFSGQRASRERDGRPMVQGLAPRDLMIQMASDDVAIASFHLGEQAPARRSIVFRRVAPGTWKVVHWHASPAPKA